MHQNNNNNNNKSNIVAKIYDIIYKSLSRDDKNQLKIKISYFFYD